MSTVNLRRVVLGVVLFIVCATLLMGQQPQQQRPRRQPAAAELVASTLPQGAKALKNIEYAKASGKSLLLDLYMPATADAGQKPKLLVWIHGGGWRGGSKEHVPLLWLVGKGYAVASINYRLSDVAIWPAQAHDCKGAIRWLRANADKYGYDAERIGISGGSAGGHLVSLLGTTADVKELEGETGGNTDRSSRIQAVVNFFGPCDFPKLEEQNHPEFTTSLVALMLNGPISANKPLAEQASPLYHVTRDDTPHLIIQGTKDPLVYVPQVQVLHEALGKIGVESTLEIIEGGGHGGPQFFDDARRAMIEKFFAKHIKEEK